MAEPLNIFQEALKEEQRYNPATVPVNILSKDFDLVMDVDRTHTTFIEQIFGVKLSVSSPEKGK